VWFIAADFKNGGVAGAYRGFEAAARVLGWKFKVVDSHGNRAEIVNFLRQAVAERPDGIVLGGFSAADFPAELALAKKARISLVGWHAAETPGANDDVFYNVSTDPVVVATKAADLVLEDARKNNRSVGVILFTDNQFSIANIKTKVMKETIERCQGYRGCKVLTTANVAIAEADTVIPKLVPRLSMLFGDEWTYSLAINDVYYDSINFPLIEAKRQSVINIAAGDGSSNAIGRIKSKQSQQIATVAEPLAMEGWQIVDELNRAFAGVSPSGFVPKPILVNKELLLSLGGGELESNHSFERVYNDIWRKK
jgi:ribose transport system substrate-binding protein